MRRQRRYAYHLKGNRADLFTYLCAGPSSCLDWLRLCLSPSARTSLGYEVVASRQFANDIDIVETLQGLGRGNVELEAN